MGMAKRVIQTRTSFPYQPAVGFLAHLIDVS